MVALVVTTGNSALSKYSQRLAKRLEIERIVTTRPDMTKGLLSLGEAYRFIRILRKHKDKTLHLPNQHLARYTIFSTAPFIITVHDLFRLCISTYEPARERIWLELDKKGIKKAEHIIAISKSTKNDLIKWLGIDEERVSVIYQGIDHGVFYPRKERPYDFRYILFVGTERRRKNLETLLKSFYELKKDERFRDLRLVKVGEPGRTEEYRRRTLEIINGLNLQGDVIFTDFVPEEELAAYYSNADCLVFPSLYEGFGLPLLEAMACGCPVITSDTSSVPEVVGDAAIMLDPTDVQGFAEATREVLTNADLRESMVRKGLEQAKKFSWEETVRKTVRVYQAMQRDFFRVPSRAEA